MKTKTLQDSLSHLIQHGWQFIPCNADLQDRIDSINRAAKDFFLSPDDDMKKAHRTEVGEGYRPFAFEYTNSKEHPDLMEWFSCSLTRSSTRSSFPDGPGLALYDTLLEAHQSFAHITEKITRELFRELDLDLGSTDRRLGFLEWSRLQVNYSRMDQASRELLVVPHEDGDFLTILTSTAPGLEIVGSEGLFADIWRPSEDRLVAIAGGILSSITGDRVRTGFHQVRRSEQALERLATIYFADPDPAAFAGINTKISASTIHELITQGWLRSGVPPVQ